MAWLLIIILAYLFFAFSSLGDKLVLQGPPNPKSYAFFAGALNLLALSLLPFVGIPILNWQMFLFLILDAAAFLFGLYFGFSAVENFEVSKVSATIGATQPIFIFFISWFFWGYQEMSFANFIAFILLLFGSIFISFDVKPEFNKKYLSLTLFSALMYSFDYVISKYIYSGIGFAQGFVVRCVFIGLFSLLFLIKKENRKQIFRKKNRTTVKYAKTFLVTQTCGGAANVLQAYAIFLAPVAVLPIMNSLRGMQYVFIFLLTLTFSFLFPKILKEKKSREIILRKFFSIIFIVAGLAILVL